MALIPLPSGLRFPVAFGAALVGGAAPTLVKDLWVGPPPAQRIVAAAAPWAGQPASLGADAQAEEAGPAPYSRAVASPDGSRLTLEMAVRRLEPDGAGGPAVLLAAAVHIADAGFYRRLQERLDGCDAVLFEGVRPPGAGAIQAADEAERIAATRRRLRFLAMALEQVRADEGALPESLEAAAQRPRTALVARARDDAWGRPILYTRRTADAGAPAAEAFDLVSLGADGAEGGEGPDADLRFSDQDPLTPAELGRGEQGIQARLAAALGLVFQKDAMDTARPGWRNSDLSVDEIMARLEGAGAQGEALFRLLDGSSLTAKFMGLLVRFIGATPSTRATAKIMLVEMLANADELVGAAPDAGGLMSVILHDRNAVVLDDLRRLLAEEPGLATVGVLYGAGHLPDLEQRLAELGYRPAGDEWVPAISVQPADAGLTPAQADAMRRMMRRSIRAQVERARGER